MNRHNEAPISLQRSWLMGIPARSLQSKSYEVGRTNPGIGNVSGQVGTPIPKSWHQVDLSTTPISRPWDQMSQVATPFPFRCQDGISPLPPPEQICQVSRPLLLGYQVASNLQSRDQMGQVIGTPPIPWDQMGQASTPLSRHLDNAVQVSTPPRQVGRIGTQPPWSGDQLVRIDTPPRQLGGQVGRIGTQPPWLGDQLGRIGTPPRQLGGQVGRIGTQPPRLGDQLGRIGTPPRQFGEVGRIGTQPPRLGDQLGYICVTNDDSRILGQGFVHLPLNPDYTLSMSTLKEVFPDATGLYYYSTDNLLMGVLQDEDKLFPPRSGDEVLYITRKMLDLLIGNNFRMKEESPVSGLLTPKDCCSVENNCPVNGLLAPKGCCNCSKLKMKVDEMTVAIKELRTEISELKYSHIFTQNGSELDENANIFKPAFTFSDREALTNYQICSSGNLDEKKIQEEMEKTIDRHQEQNFDDIVHTPDIQEIDKSIDIDEEMVNCAEMKTDKVNSDNTGIQAMEKYVELEKVELIDEKQSIEEIEKCMKMKNAELIDLVSDKSPSAANETSRKPIINTRTASWVLDLPIVPVKTESEIPAKISPTITTSKAKLIHGNSIDKTVHNNIDSNEKPTSFQSEKSSGGKNLLSSNQLVPSNTNSQFKPDESPPCDKSENLLTLRPKLCSKKNDKKSSKQLVSNKVLEKGGIYDSDESNENSPSMQASDQTPLCGQVGLINNHSRIKNDSSTVSTKDSNIVTFHVQRGSSIELTQKFVHDFFSSNYGKVNSVEYNSSSGKGIVRFASKITKDVFCKAIEINDCTVYTSRRLEDLTEESVKTQILLESRHLTLGWDRSIILRKHFQKFGEVLGVVFIGKKGEFKRAIVGFDDEKVAERLVGITEVINGARVMIQRVNSKTI